MKRMSFIFFIITCFVVITSSCNSSASEEQEVKENTVPKSEISDTMSTASLPAENNGGSSLPRKLPLNKIRNGDSLSIFRDTSIRISRNDRSFLRVFVSSDSLYLIDKNNKRVMIDEPRNLNPYIMKNRADISEKKVVLFISNGTPFRKASLTLRALEFSGVRPTVLAE